MRRPGQHQCLHVDSLNGHEVYTLGRQVSLHHFSFSLLSERPITAATRAPLSQSLSAAAVDWRRILQYTHLVIAAVDRATKADICLRQLAK